MKKILLLLLLAVVVILGILYFKPLFGEKQYQDDVLAAASDWKTYENKAMKFLLKYPGDWTVDDSFDENTVSIWAPDQGGFGVYREKLSKKDQKKKLKDILKARDDRFSKEMGAQDQKYIVSSKTVKVGKKSGIRRVEYTDAAGLNLLQSYVINGEYLYLFSLYNSPLNDSPLAGAGSIDKVEEATYDKILKSVKFIK